MNPADPPVAGETGTPVRSAAPSDLPADSTATPAAPSITESNSPVAIVDIRPDSRPQVVAAPPRETPAAPTADQSHGDDTALESGTAPIPPAPEAEAPSHIDASADASEGAGQNGEKEHGARHAGAAQRPAARQARRRRLHLPSREQVLASLAQLATAVLLGEVQRDVATTAKTVLDTYLRHMAPAGPVKGGANSLNMGELRGLAAQAPGLASVLEHLLSDEQLDELLGVEKQATGTAEEPGSSGSHQEVDP